MKKGLKILLIVIAVLVAGALGLFYFSPKYAQNILIPDITQVEKIKIKIRGDTAYGQLNLLLENKGIFKINIDSLDYAVNFDTLRVLSKQQDLAIVLSPGARDTFVLPMALPFKRIGTRIRQLQERDSADIVTDIRIVYSTIFGRAVLPHKKTNRIGMPRPPRFELEKLELKKFMGKTLLLKAHVTLHNRGNLDLVLSDLRYKVNVEDLMTASGTETGTLAIRPGSVQRIELPITLEIKKGIKTARLVITDKDVVNYSLRIRGRVSAGKLGDEPSDVELSRNGTLELKK